MNQYETWVLAHVVERDGARMGHLYETAPFGRDNVKKAVKSLLAAGEISRQGVTIFPTDRNRLNPTLKPTETDGMVSPHAPLPKDLKTGSNRAREAVDQLRHGDKYPYAVVCTWREFRGANGLCDFAHQDFFGNRNDAFAHFKAHCREPHPSEHWEVALVERKTGENLESWSTEPYEPIPYEVAKLGINAFIKSQIEKNRI